MSDFHVGQRVEMTPLGRAQFSGPYTGEVRGFGSRSGVRVLRDGHTTITTWAEDYWTDPEKKRPCKECGDVFAAKDLDDCLGCKRKKSLRSVHRGARVQMKPLAIDLCAGLGGWTDGLLAEGWDVIGFDIERHKYGAHQYPAQLVLQDILTLDGRQFHGKVSLIVASPPCQKYSYMAMPWTKAKDLIRWHRDPEHPERIDELNALFNACLRIGREAGCPIVIENVRGAIPWVGRSRWNYGSYHLWGDVPALMPITLKRSVIMKAGIAHRGDVTNFHGVKVPTMGAGWYPPGHPKHVPGLGFNTHADRQTRDDADADHATKNDGGSWFNVAHNTTSGKGQNPDGRLHGDDGERTDDLRRMRGDGAARTPVLREGDVRLSGVPGGGSALSDDGIKVPSERGRRTDVGNGARFTSEEQAGEGRKQKGSGREWFAGKGTISGTTGSKSSARKAASARIAKIPLALARHIARVYFPKAQ